MARVGEEQYRASLEEGSCVACDRKRPPWFSPLLGWKACRKCGANHCRRHSKEYRGGSLLTGWSFTWDWLYCETTNSRRSRPESVDL